MDEQTVAFFEEALAGLPDRPADLTSDDLETLAALTRGLTRHMVELHEAHVDLARRLVEDDAADLHQALRERDKLAANDARFRQVDGRLASLLSRALRARAPALAGVAKALGTPWKTDSEEA